MKYFKIKNCEQSAANASNYAEWLAATERLESLKGIDKWQADNNSPFYPRAILEEQISALKGYRKNQLKSKLMDFLQEELHRSAGELSDYHLYDHSSLGTKLLVEEYLNEIEFTLHHFCESKIPGVDISTKERIFLQAINNFGQSALMLSGGGTLAISHFGVVKAMLEHRILPQVICGSSMGAVVAAVIGTRRDEELLNTLKTPSNQNFIPIRYNKLNDIYSSGALLDEDKLMECISHNIPELTFLEAYKKTNRIINITVSPARSGQKPFILNYKTTPNISLRHACKASCSIPLLFPGTPLMKKNSHDDLIMCMGTERWIDGSVHSDIPMTSISRLHNVNHFIVSQTNPHILPLIAYRQKSGVLPFFLDWSASGIHAFWHQLISTSKKRIRNRKIRFLLERADSILGQDYSGDINLAPKLSMGQHFKSMTNPSDKEVNQLILAGEQATWPKLAMIRQQTRISHTLLRCYERIKAQSHTKVENH